MQKDRPPFLEGFLADIEGGKCTLEDGSINVYAIASRADLYQERLRGSANEAFFSSLPDDELIDWLLGGDEVRPALSAPIWLTTVRISQVKCRRGQGRAKRRVCWDVGVARRREVER